jgi:hypothetical protein
MIEAALDPRGLDHVLASPVRSAFVGWRPRQVDPARGRRGLCSL